MQPATSTTFGQWLKTRRKELELTRVQLASQVGCAEITLEKIERDQRRPSKQIAELLASALQIPDVARDQFVLFARVEGEPPILDGSTPHSTTGAPLTNLPTPLTSFVDRANELAEVRDRLLRPDRSTPSVGQEVRLLTLVGPPGIGKTRLSIQAGQSLLDHFADGVWFVPLAPISDTKLVLPAIAHVFDIAEGGTVPLLERLQTYLRPCQMLLILDNFEHMLDAAPGVSNLLKGCKKVKVLATSREALRVYGEHEYRMPALSLPPHDKKLTAEQFASFDALKLFVARAQAFQADFELTADNTPIVADICLRLDGLPLAIELATAQLRHFTLPRLRDALKDAPMQTLVGALRDVEPRQRSVHATIQWSYDLLTPAERAAFNRLGVFVGGCTTEAALAVCELGNDTTLHDLADRSLLKRESGGDGESRWTMLEMIHEFALDALQQFSSDELTRARQRHAEYFAHILKSGSDESWRIIDVEQHNARAALRWLLEHKHSLTGQLALWLSIYLNARGLNTECRRWLREALAADIEMAPPIHNDLLSSASLNAWQQHDFDEGLRYGYEALAISRAMNLQSLIADDLSMLSRIYVEMDDSVQAKTVALEALQISRAIQDPVTIAGALIHLGSAELILGDVDQASACFEEAYALCQAPDFRQRVYAGLACKGMGLIALGRRDYDRALEYLREGVRRAKLTATQLEILNPLAGVIGTMPRRTTADICVAAKIWGATQALNERMGTEVTPGDRRRMDALITEARSRINTRIFATAWAEGRELSLEGAVALAMG